MRREEFLAKQAARFDKQYAKPTPIIVELIACFLLSGAVFGAYELVAFGVSKVAEKFDNGEESN